MESNISEQNDPWIQALEKAVMAFSKAVDTFNQIGMEINPTDRSFQGLPVLKESIEQAKLKLPQLERDVDLAKKIVTGFHHTQPPKTRNSKNVNHLLSYISNQIKSMNDVLAISNPDDSQSENETMQKFIALYNELIKQAIIMFETAMKEGFIPPPTKDAGGTDLISEERRNRIVNDKNNPRNSNENDSFSIIDKLMFEGKINVGQAKLAALNEDYRNCLLDKLKNEI